MEMNDRTVLGAEQWKLLDFTSDWVQSLPGKIVEVGVYRGGSAWLLCQKFYPQPVILIDTFEGLPASLIREDCDGHKPGAFSCDIESVRSFLPDNARLFKMIYPPTDPDEDPCEGKHIRFLHLDVDLYHSVMRSLMVNWPRMVTHGVVLIDDYNDSACRGAQAAVNEFCVQNRIQIHTSFKGPQCWLIKVP